MTPRHVAASRKRRSSRHCNCCLFSAYCSVATLFSAAVGGGVHVLLFLHLHSIWFIFLASHSTVQDGGFFFNIQKTKLDPSPREDGSPQSSYWPAEELDFMQN